MGQLASLLGLPTAVLIYIMLSKYRGQYSVFARILLAFFYTWVSWMVIAVLYIIAKSLV